jgi:hypothetical protein
MSEKKLYLNDFTKEIVVEGDKISVVYTNGEFKGECSYIERAPLTRLQSELMYILITSDMGDVIEYIHKKSPLKSEDINEIQMMIREDSHEFIKAQGPYQR